MDRNRAWPLSNPQRHPGAAAWSVALVSTPSSTITTVPAATSADASLGRQALASLEPRERSLADRIERDFGESKLSERLAIDDRHAAVRDGAETEP
jgi:hypothetical protein